MRRGMRPIAGLMPTGIRPIAYTAVLGADLHSTHAHAHAHAHAHTHGDTETRRSQLKQAM